MSNLKWERAGATAERGRIRPCGSRGARKLRALSGARDYVLSGVEEALGGLELVEGEMTGVGKNMTRAAAGWLGCRIAWRIASRLREHFLTRFTRVLGVFEIACRRRKLVWGVGPC